MAVAVSLWRRMRADFRSSSCKSASEAAAAASPQWSPSGPHPERRSPYEKVVTPSDSTLSVPPFFSAIFRSSDTNSLDFEQQLLGARRRARHLRLVRPPTPSELRRSRGTRRREDLLRISVRCLCRPSVFSPVCVLRFQISHWCRSHPRDLFVCGSMLLLMLCINHCDSFSHHHHLHQAVTRGFLRYVYLLIPHCLILLET